MSFNFKKSLIYYKVLFINFFLVVNYTAFASHVSGGFINYECTGPNTYFVTLTITEDCSYSFIPYSINI